MTEQYTKMLWKNYFTVFSLEEAEDNFSFDSPYYVALLNSVHTRLHDVQNKIDW